MTKLLLAGDIAPVGFDRLVVGPAARERLGAPDLVIANLEVPLAPPGTAPAAKAGPTLRGEAAPVEEFRRHTRRLALSLANNHMMDHGATGLEATVAQLRRLDVTTAGAGTLEQAAACRTIEVGPARIALLAACDPQFGLAEADRPGVAALGPALHASIRHACVGHDRVVLSVHGGAELSRWPGPGWLETLCTFADAGADIVYAHHPHLAQGVVRHRGSWIVLGPGNLLVNPASWRPSATRTSLAFEFDLGVPDAPPQCSEWRCTEGSCGAVVLECTRPEVPNDDPLLLALNRPPADPVLLRSLWQEYAMDQWDRFYAPILSARSPAREAAARLVHAVHPARSRRRLQDSRLLLLHLFRCAQHQEAASAALALLSGDAPDTRTPESARLYDEHVRTALCTGES